jgi:hypothetical protein
MTHHNQIKKITTWFLRRFTPTLTHGGDAFGRELVGNHRFGSSGLNLVFEGLLLEMILRLRVKATSSNPCKSDSESATPTHNAMEASLCFAGNHWHRRYVVGSRRYQRSPDEGLGRRAMRKLSGAWRMWVEGGVPTVIRRPLRHHRGTC